MTPLGLTSPGVGMNLTAGQLVQWSGQLAQSHVHPPPARTPTFLTVPRWSPRKSTVCRWTAAPTTDVTLTLYWMAGVAVRGTAPEIRRPSEQKSSSASGTWGQTRRFSQTWGQPGRRTGSFVSPSIASRFDRVEWRQSDQHPGKQGQLVIGTRQSSRGW